MRGVPLLALMGSLVLAPLSVHAGPKEEAHAVVEQWAAVFNAGDVDKFTALYARDATVHGTVSANLASDAEALRAYFSASAAGKTQVKMGEWSAAELSPEAVVVAGFYEFSGKRRDGQPFELPARYTFVLVKRGGDWRIAHQHSSSRPRPSQ
jgi:uncharacterized protein (TIGR02246 family)